MKKGTILSVILLSVFLVACAQQPQMGTSVKPAGGSAPGIDVNSPLRIVISMFKFSPSELTIKVGETATWVNEDDVSHTVTSDSGSELDSPSIGKGQSFSHTFNTAGTYTYHCSIHPGMTAKIVVG